jgi:HEAT repeat protein
MRGTIVMTTSLRDLCLRLAFGLGLAALPSLVYAQVPGVETFAIEPRTPLELWHAIDYLVRTEQAKDAVPYLEKFAASRPDDATLMAIRDKYGAGTFLRLDDFPETRKYAEPLVTQLSDATRRQLRHPLRISESISELVRTPEERRYAVARLREAGAYAVPALVEALGKPDLSPADRALLVHGMGRLDAKAVPALIAVLDSPDPAIAADAASALGAIGDRRAVPFLIAKAADRKRPTPPAVKSAARSAIERITGKSLEAQSESPVRLLTDAAWSFHRHRVGFPGETVAVWEWDQAAKGPALRVLTKAQAESVFARKLGQAAVDLDPGDFKAKVALASAELEEATDRVGFDALGAKESPAIASTAAMGPEVLTAVVRDSIADGKPELTAAAVLALGKASRDLPLTGPDGSVHPLVEALGSPGRRAQIAAARAIIAMAPERPFPGSSRLVPVLARLVDNQAAPRGVVIDGNPNRAGRLAGLLKELGYVPDSEPTGPDGFRAAAETGDVEVILISYDLFRGPWNLSDTLSNLRTDSRTALIPIYIYGPLHLIRTRPGLLDLYPGVKFVVQPDRPADLERQMGGRPALLSPSQRTAYAVEAAALLAKIATRPSGPFAAELAAAEPSLAQAVNQPEVAIDASTALGGIASAGAQRILADVIIDPAYPLDLRRNCSSVLAGSLKRFGALVAADQEAKLVAASRLEADAGLKTGLIGVLDALRARRVDNSPTAANL